MRLAAALDALAAYGEASEPDAWRVSDLLTDLLVIVRERQGSEVAEGVLRRVRRDLDAEPESADDLAQIADLADRDGLHSWAAKLRRAAWEAGPGRDAVLGELRRGRPGAIA